MRAERVLETERRTWTHERTAFLQGELTKTPLAPRSEVAVADSGRKVPITDIAEALGSRVSGQVFVCHSRSREAWVMVIRSLLCCD